MAKGKVLRAVRGDGKPSTKAWLLLEEPRTMGQRIRWLRIAAGWTQTELAAMSAEAADYDEGLTKSFLSLLEADRTHASVRTLAAVAASLGATMDWLYTGRVPRRSKPPVRVRLRFEGPKAVAPPRRKVFVVVERERGGRMEVVERELSREASYRVLVKRGDAAPPEQAHVVIPQGGNHNG